MTWNSYWVNKKKRTQFLKDSFPYFANTETFKIKTTFFADKKETRKRYSKLQKLYSSIIEELWQLYFEL